MDPDLHDVLRADSCLDLIVNFDRFGRSTLANHALSLRNASRFSDVGVAADFVLSITIAYKAVVALCSLVTSVVAITLLSYIGCPVDIE